MISVKMIDSTQAVSKTIFREALLPMATYIPPASPKSTTSSPAARRRPSLESASSTLRPIFDKFDADGSGTVSVSELGKITSLMKLKLSPAELKKLVVEADADGSGEVSFDEFASLIRKQQAGGLGDIVVQANSMFGWLPSFSSWFGAGSSAPEEPVPQPSPTPPTGSFRQGGSVYGVPVQGRPFKPELLHADSMILALSDGKRESHSFRMGHAPREMLRGGAGIGVGPYEPAGVSISPQGRRAAGVASGTTSPISHRLNSSPNGCRQGSGMLGQRNNFSRDVAKFENGETLTIDMMAALRPWNKSTLETLEA